ncbi:copper amine oxidase N-terminal domain-containing protein [Lysinibacillus parviboronicapiens]|uniref:copper amine oxidase N-terminal domain-containing protein n=1 Tax=Lysinibacillus parviboronicapiens TaxID=436516 RepID=UPI00187D3C2D|nr:copper amine oxidase N-terminal domain-containing protein [Lysinibacillus parviboronicapiens]
MKKKRISLIVALLLTCTFIFGLSVRADDDNEHEYKKHEKYDDDDRYEYDDDDDDRYEFDESYKMNGEVYEKGTWNIWSRELVMEKEVLPFSASKLVNLKVADMNKELNFYVIPKDGEFFVPGKTVAQLLGAKATFYKTSKILVIQYQENELVFRSGTNVAYDNNVKTPLPASSFYLNEELYVPICVITNGLGYVVEWQEDSQVFLCQLLIK